MKDKKDEGLAGWELPLVITLVGGGLWSKYGLKAQAWFHDNMLEVVGSGILLFALVGIYLVSKYQKKREAEIKRARSLNHVRPRTDASFYTRRDQDVER